MTDSATSGERVTAYVEKRVDHEEARRARLETRAANVVTGSAVATSVLFAILTYARTAERLTLAVRDRWALYVALGALAIAAALSVVAQLP